MISEFEKDLSSLINRYSQENFSGTPDYILAEYLVNCLTAFSVASNKRNAWYGRSDSINGASRELAAPKGEGDLMGRGK